MWYENIDLAKNNSLYWVTISHKIFFRIFGFIKWLCIINYKKIFNLFLIKILFDFGGIMHKKNILMDNLVLFDKKEIDAIENSSYDEKRGLWLWGDDNEVLVKSTNVYCPIRGTKKFDIESGEDQKGE